MRNLPLKGIRVLDFCQMFAGPHTTEWLSVMGAEVIKVETNIRLDYLRTVGAPPGLAGSGPDAGSAFASLNWGKKSVVLNMLLPKARELARRLIKISDVIAENFGGNVFERWELTYADLKIIKPDIIYYAGSGYGRTGPYSDRPAYAEIVDAYTGATFANGYYSQDPAIVGVSAWTDSAQAMYGSFAILAALYHRFVTGKGQYIDAAMIEGSANFLGELVMNYIINGNIGERTGNRSPFMAPHGCYPCRATQNEAEWVAIVVSNQSEWEVLIKLMGNPEWSRREEFSDELKRWHNQAELDRNIGAWTRNFGAYAIAAKLQKAGIAACASLSTKQFSDDAHIQSRQFLLPAGHPVLGNVLIAGLPFNFSDSPHGNYEAAPRLGEHNDNVFGQLLGLSPDEIHQLVAEGVLY